MSEGIPGQRNRCLLRVCIVADEATPAWLLEARDRVASSPHAGVRLAVAPSAAPGRHEYRSLVGSLYGKVESWVYPPLVDAEGVVTAPVPSCITTIDAADLSQSLSSSAEAPLSTTSLFDAVLWLSLQPPIREMANAARLGLWTLRFGDDLQLAGPEIGLREVLERSPTTRVALVASEFAGTESVLEEAFISTDDCSGARNRSKACQKAALLPARALARIALAQDPGPDWAAGVIRKMLDAKSPSPLPSERAPVRIARCGLQHGLRRARVVVRKRLGSEDWFIRTGASGSGRPWRVDRWRAIEPPPDRFWADPMAVASGDQTIVFIEEYLHDQAKGRIAALTLDAGGRLLDHRTVLECDHHLSYPFVFSHEGDFFMVPEQGDTGTVDIYRCSRFPDVWEWAGHLLEGVRAFDTTLHRQNGRWWMFTTVQEGVCGATADELHIFSSQSLLESPGWTAHPLNPIVCDARRARSAGPLFEWQGNLYRPSQDCSKRYGHAVLVNRVDELSMTGYSEVEIDRLAPSGSSPLLGVHTLSIAGSRIVSDGVRWRRRRW